MAGNTVNGGRASLRSGAQTVALLAVSRNALILRALERGPQRQVALRRATDSPPQTTLRAQLRKLEHIHVVEAHRRNSFPGTIDYELSTQGSALLAVLDKLEAWLGQSPGGALAIGGNEAKAAILALTEAWSTTMLRPLAIRPLSLTELDRVVLPVSYPSLERRLAALRLAGLVRAHHGEARGTPYTVTEWLRRGMAPIIAAMNWERRNLADATAPTDQLDAETSLLLTIPILRLPSGVSGTCRLAIEGDNSEHRLTGLVAEIRDGAIAACTTNLNGQAGAWALGSPSAWLTATAECDVAGLELGGDTRLARHLIECLHQELFQPTTTIGT